MHLPKSIKEAESGLNLKLINRYYYYSAPPYGICATKRSRLAVHCCATHRHATQKLLETAAQTNCFRAFFIHFLLLLFLLCAMHQTTRRRFVT